MTDSLVSALTVYFENINHFYNHHTARHRNTQSLPNIDVERSTFAVNLIHTLDSDRRLSIAKGISFISWKDQCMTLDHAEKCCLLESWLAPMRTFPTVTVRIIEQLGRQQIQIPQPVFHSQSQTFPVAFTLFAGLIILRFSAHT